MLLVLLLVWLLTWARSGRRAFRLLLRTGVAGLEREREADEEEEPSGHGAIAFLCRRRR